jgi:hypothetical protein
LFGPVIAMPGIPADDLGARNPSHLLENGIGKKNLIGIVCDHDTHVPCFENGPHLFERLPPSAVYELTLFSGPRHVEQLLIRLASEAIEHMLDVHVARDKLRALV